MPLLTVKDIENAKPKDKLYRLYDAWGLFIEIAPVSEKKLKSGGGKRWRFKYRRIGTNTDNNISLGTYPVVSLKMARDRRDEMRRLLSDGIDPSENRKDTKKSITEREANTFRAVTLDWHEKKTPHLSEHYRKKILKNFDYNVFSKLGDRPIAQITGSVAIKYNDNFIYKDVAL